MANVLVGVDPEVFHRGVVFSGGRNKFRYYVEAVVEVVSADPEIREIIAERFHEIYNAKVNRFRSPMAGVSREAQLDRE